MAFARFGGFDFYQLDALLSDEEKLARRTVREFVEQEVLPIIDRHYEEGTYPHHLTARMGELGLLGANLPGKYGGAGLSNVAYGLVMQELERGDSGIRSAASVQGGLVMYPIHAWGSEEQRQAWLPALAAGKAVGCFGLTEPDSGSNPAGMKAVARRDGRDWILNGTKMWITNGTGADVAVVWARAEGEVMGFLVEKERRGFSAPEMKHKMSLRASVTSELVLEDVRVPDGNRLPGIRGLKGPLSCLTQARYGIAWGALGAAMACLHAALEYSKERIQFDRPIAAFQITQVKLADMLAGITKGQLLCLQLGRMKDRGTMTHEQVSLAKRDNVAMALEVAREARSLLGANGILLEYPVIRHLMNLESVKTYEGTHEMQTLILGQALTGIPAFR